MRTLLTTFIIVVITASASAIRCYVCNSHNETECLNIAPGSRSKFLTDCETIEDGHTYTLCRKIDMYMDMNFGETHPQERRIHRACGYIEYEDERVCDYNSGLHVRSWTCDCHEDECNGVGRSGPLLIAIVVAFLLCFIRKTEIV